MRRIGLALFLFSMSAQPAHAGPIKWLKAQMRKLSGGSAQEHAAEPMRGTKATSVAPMLHGGATPVSRSAIEAPAADKVAPTFRIDPTPKAEPEGFKRAEPRIAESYRPIFQGHQEAI